MTDRANRLGQLDGLRGVAALVVVAHHYFLAFAPSLQPNRPNTPHWLFDTPLALLYNGGFAVSLFFVVSGFVVANAAAGRKAPLPVNLLIRYLRLALPVLASVLYAWVLLNLFRGAVSEVKALQNYGWLAQSYSDQIPGLPYAIWQGLFEVFWTGSSLFNNPLWTMRTELLGSFVVYLIYAVTRGRWTILALIAGGGAAVFTGHKEYLAFALGALLREAWAEKKLVSAAAWPALIAGLLIGAPLQRAAVRLHTWDLPFFSDLGVTLGLTAIVGAALTVYAVMASPLVSRVFSAPGPLFLGRISFMLYLVHVPLIFTVWSKLFAWAWPVSGLDLAAGLALLYGASIAIAWAGTRYVDEPLQRFVGALRKRLTPRKPGIPGRG